MGDQQSTTDALRRRRSLRRLALYSPFNPDARIETVCRELVLAAVHENDARIASCIECQQIIHNLWGLELELTEISAAARRLVKQGKLIEEHGHRHLSDECSNSLAKRVRTSNEVETTAFEEWEQLVRRRFRSLGTLQLAQLREDLASWIQHIISEYGVEAGILLSPQRSRHAQYLDEVNALGDGVLPKRSADVMMVRAEALGLFFDEKTPMRERFFDNLLATAYLMSVFTLDPTALGGVRQLTNGQRLYLDTNLVYSLLRLNGPERYRATQRVLNLSFHLGYQVCVTPWTATEMQESVRLTRLRLARAGPSPQNLANLAQHDDDEKFIRAFRQLHRESGLSLEDFLALHENIDLLLNAEGVEVVDEGCEAVDAAADRFDELIGTLERERGDGPEKPRALQEHDVKLRLLVQLLRGDKRRRFSNVGYLVLSNDHVLCRFAEQHLDRSWEVPFAVSLSKWAHITRSLTPRTMDYDQTLADIHETPSVRPSGLISQADIVEAQNRINAHEKYPEPITMRMLLDKALGGRNAQAGDDAERTDSQTPASEVEVAQVLDLEEKVRELLRQAALEQRGRTAERAEQAAREEGVRADLRAERRRRMDLERQLERLRGQLSSLRAMREPESPRADYSIVISKLEAQLTLVQQQLARDEKLVRWTVGSLICLVGVAILALPVAGLANDGWAVVVDICGGGGILLGGFAWICGARKASALATAVGLTLGAVASVRTLTSADQSGAPQPPVHASDVRKPPGPAPRGAAETVAHGRSHARSRPPQNKR